VQESHDDHSTLDAESEEHGSLMCGRLAIFTPPLAMARLLEAGLADGIDPDGHPSWNIGPTQRIDGVGLIDDDRVLDRFRWGLIPSWAKDASFGSRAFNARSETVASKPSFRSAYKRHRLLIPVDGFYEWDRSGSGKPQPHYFHRADGAPVVMAGLHETWTDPAAPDDEPPVRSATIITTTAGPDMKGIHDRMPVILEADTFDLWLTGDGEDDAVADLMRPALYRTLAHHPVDRAVGNVRNDGPELIDEPPATTLF
jgi:putative SOS response-associated peptidase YedK